MDNQFVLRRAVMNDIKALSELRQKTFRETFLEDFSIPYPEKDLDTFLRSSSSPESFAENIHDPKGAIWVIEDKTNSELVAFVMAGPCYDDEIPHPDVCSDKDAELNRLYVRRDLQSHGFGQQLMNVILPWLEEHYPARPIWLTVWSRNFKAQKFYNHYGFSKVGEFDYCVGEWKDLEFIMKRQTNIY
jgi:ribosomal protein S18 acetylase RimI-like enzyme